MLKLVDTLDDESKDPMTKNLINEKSFVIKKYLFILYGPFADLSTIVHTFHPHNLTKKH